MLRQLCKNYALVFRRADALRIMRTFDTESSQQRGQRGSRDADQGPPRPSENRQRTLTLPSRGDNSLVSHGLLRAAIPRLREGDCEKRLFSHKNEARDGDWGGVATLNFLCRMPDRRDDPTSFRPTWLPPLKRSLIYESGAQVRGNSFVTVELGGQLPQR